MPAVIRRRHTTSGTFAPAAAKSLAIGYGVTAGMLYAAVCRDREGVAADATALGLGTWAAGYLGWLPALNLMAPLTEQPPKQVAGSVIHHVLFGVATVAAYRYLKKLAQPKGA